MSALLLVRASMLLATALAGAWLLRRSSATTRHAAWTMAFVALLSLPALPYVLPVVPVPVPARWQPAAQSTESSGHQRDAQPALARDLPPADGGETSSRAAAIAAVPAPVPVRPVVSFRVLIAIAWLAGTLAALASLILSLLRVRSLNRSASELTDVAWRDAADDIAARLGCAPPALRVSHAVAAPMAGGVARPTIFLPASAPEWSSERRDIVLAHEIAHLARRDPLRHIAARVAVAFYWFHPLAWIAASRASAAREQACDEAVLALGTRPSAYAQVLLDFSETRPGAGLSAAALPIVEPSLLEQRLMAILAHDARFSVRRRPFAAVAAVAAVALGIAAANPAAGTATPMGETIDVPPAQVRPAAAAPAESRCDAESRAMFHGSMSSSDRSGRGVVYDVVGTTGADRIIFRTIGDVRLCMVAEDAAGDDETLKPSEWPARARRTLIEASNGAAAQRLEITREGAAQRVRWFVGGRERPFDAAAQAWRDQMLQVLDGTWELSRIRGEASALRGEISALRGEESSMRGEISSLRGEVSSLRGEISSTHGEESSLRGEISSIQGHVSSLRGQVSAERGSISSLNASRYDTGEADRTRIAERVGLHEQEIARLEKEIQAYNADAKIAAVERQIAQLDVSTKVEKLESQIRATNTEARIAEIEKRIRALNVDGRSAAIEKRIAALDVDRRSSEIEARTARDLKQLQDAIARIR